MNTYARALQAYLASPGALKQSELAEKAKCKQASISRYANNDRFPDAQTASRIAEATDNKVSFDIWRQVAAERAGLAA